ncbi:MAG: substrate-binding domain-containing protein [Phycisphaerae bacterium]
MRQPCRALGQVAVQVMKERCAGSDLPGRQVLLQAELVVRQSCGG